MNMSRRRFSGAAGAASAAGVLVTTPHRLLAAGLNNPVLRAQVRNVQLAPPDYPQTEIWGYDGRMPGPEIRLGQGQRQRRTLKNSLPQATPVHWHGVRSDNAMDGVAGLTQQAVVPGAEFDYNFVVPDAGTYWYHAHMPGGNLGPLRDTLMTFAGQTREIAFMANNPGDWLFHCHMLSHANSGMMAWLKVVA